MVYNYDWSSTVLGPINLWNPALKNALGAFRHLPTNQKLHISRDTDSEHLRDPIKFGSVPAKPI
ncbi:hypothetical protein C2G38_2157508 [Gigaspora rosea]|uniref:Uncharacterized protein n=1 Tax=Gigaspora rosea TaxID=44941 RepID=A0A397W3I8_9GLOM|nr:hypothetical protein C2G38_2157508 [Gigaspora rosea]